MIHRVANKTILAGPALGSPHLIIEANWLDHPTYITKSSMMTFRLTHQPKLVFSQHFTRPLTHTHTHTHLDRVYERCIMAWAWLIGVFRYLWFGAIASILPHSQQLHNFTSTRLFDMASPSLYLFPHNQLAEHTTATLFRSPYPWLGYGVMGVFLGVSICSIWFAIRIHRIKLTAASGNYTWLLKVLPIWHELRWWHLSWFRQLSNRKSSG